LAAIAVKNHSNGALNQNAQFQRRITIEDVLNSPVISDPLRVYDFCPITDGAAALVLAPVEAQPPAEKSVVVSGIGAATDTQTLQERADVLRMASVRVAGERAYRMAGIGPGDIDVAELHDMATILEVVESAESRSLGGRIMVSLPAYRCTGCGTVSQPRRARCRQCGRSDVEQVELRRGKLLTFTRVTATRPGYPSPMILGLAEFEYGVKLVARV